MTTPPIVIAHAGGSHLAPANTLAAFRQAQSEFEGVWIDCDLRFASDGELVVIHDETLAKTTPWHGLVSERSCEELAKCNAAVSWPEWGFQPVPSARAMFTEAGTSGWHLVVELKNIPRERTFEESGRGHAEALLRLVEETGFPLERLLVMCFWPNTLDQIKTREPGLKVGLLTAPKRLDDSPGPTAPQVVRFCIERGYALAGPEHHTAELAEGVDLAHSNGIRIQVWTPNAPQDIEQAIAIGVDQIVSDRPDLVMAARGRMAGEAGRA